jgi:hypothetical protein
MSATFGCKSPSFGCACRERKHRWRSTLLNPKHWIREVAGIGERRQTIARESAAHEAEERVQIVSPANAEGRQLNTASATP